MLFTQTYSYSYKRSKVIKKIFLGIVLSIVFLTSIVLQHKFDFLYSIVYLENKYLHKESLKTDLRLTRVGEQLNKPLYRLDVLSVLHFSQTPSSEVRIFIPEEFSILKQPDFFYLKEVTPGFSGIRYRIGKRKYRDVSGGVSLFIYPLKGSISEKPFITLIERDGKTLHKNVPYTIKSSPDGISLVSKMPPRT